MSRKAVWIGGIVGAAFILAAAAAFGTQYVYDNLSVTGPSGQPAKIGINIVDGRFGESWTALRDTGGTPAELELAPVPNQYDQVTVKTWLAILGKGTATIPDDPALPPFDARLLMSGPWPASYCALRDDGSSPATLEINPLAEYTDIDATIKDTGRFRILDANGQMLFEVDGAEGECPKWRQQTGYVTISPAAWQPTFMDTGYGYRGSYATIVEPPPFPGSYAFHAPVQLPHGCTVTSITWYWYDSDPVSDIEYQLTRHTLGLGGTVSVMASGNSTGSSGLGSTTDATVGLATIDNSQYSYVVRGEAFGLDPAYQHWLQEVKIEYTYTGPH